MARILYGGRISIEIALATQAIGIAVGGTVGAVGAYIGGLFDSILMRIVDVLIAFPALVLALVIADGLGPGELHVIWAISFFTVPGYARIARASTLKIKDQPYMVAARLSGSKRWRILLEHVVPNVLPALLTFACLLAGVVIIVGGALNFLGLGVRPPAPTWGNMINEGQNLLSARPSLVLIPSAFLFATVVALNLLGDGLRRRWGVD